jgi:hypothetical protein
LERFADPMIRAAIITVLLCLLFAHAAEAGNGANGIAVRPYSQQYSQSRAGAGARIDLHRRSDGRPTAASRPIEHVAVDTSSTNVRVKVIGGSTDAPLQGPLYPSLSASSPILKNGQPVGPGSFWYSDGAGHVCMYAPSSVLPCFTVTGAAVPPVAPLDPAAIAAHVVDRLRLSPGEVKSSPTRTGLTGAQSWFWLQPAPTRQSLSIALAGETVNVTAVPTVEWRFGDGASLDGGPGVPYQADAPPSNAITHVYDTRCLPGDQGHDPYVLASCGQAGYSVEALVVWRITYSAAGPIAASGALPARTTEASTAYPVSESRAFLVSGGGQ